MSDPLLVCSALRYTRWGEQMGKIYGEYFCKYEQKLVK